MSLDDQELSSLVRRHATRHRAPASLRAGVRMQAALAEANRAPAPGARGALAWLRPGAWAALRWRTAGAGFAMGLACALLVLPLVPRLNLGEPLDADLVADHVRALRAGPLVEVVSTDRHTVKPWFQGRLDYAPPVFDLGADGFPLAGGRIEHVRGEVVAALAYRSERHVIDVFVWPADTRVAPASSVRRGFNVLHWADGSMQYWAVSDLERAQLERFGQLWRERVAAAQ